LPKPPKGVVLFVEIAGDRVSRFKPSNPDNLAEHYRNKWIRVTGKIEVEGDGDSGDKDVVIKVVDQAQITVIDKRK
jgi:hypothetical protein